MAAARGDLPPPLPEVVSTLVERGMSVQAADVWLRTPNTWLDDVTLLEAAASGDGDGTWRALHGLFQD